MSVAPPRLIAHLDMDAFYASVELLRYPELRGRPVVIGGGRRHQPEEIVDPDSGRIERRFATLRGYAGRGVITTATYEARAFGLHSALGLMKAAQLAPDTILLPVDFDAYRRYSRLFKAAVGAIAPEIEDRGIDEIFVDLTGIVLSGASGADDGWLRARETGLALKQAVRSATGLSCSIGIAPNKLLAKIASELDKPDGLTLLPMDDIAARVWPLPARRINGIGPKSSARLQVLGIRTIGELAAADPALLLEHFGAHYGAWMHEAAHGRDERPVVTYSEPQSISRETTFDRDLHPSRVSDDLTRKGYVGRTIGLKLRYDNFKTLTRDRTIPQPTQDARTIRRAASECLKRVPLDRRIRLLGVRVGALCRADEAASPVTVAAEEPTRNLFE